LERAGAADQRDSVSLAHHTVTHRCMSFRHSLLSHHCNHVLTMCAMCCFPTDNELPSTTTMATMRSTALVFAMMLEAAVAQVSRSLNPCLLWLHPTVARRHCVLTMCPGALLMSTVLLLLLAAAWRRRARQEVCSPTLVLLSSPMILNFSSSAIVCSSHAASWPQRSRDGHGQRPSSRNVTHQR
jgi:hypothetical protein